jgi:energy-converting hydrogenase Eha subunit E
MCDLSSFLGSGMVMIKFGMIECAGKRDRTSELVKLLNQESPAVGTYIIGEIWLCQ